MIRISQELQNLFKNATGRRFGISLVALVSIPFVLLLVLVFLCFGLILQSQQKNFGRIYSERTAEFLAHDLADEMSSLMSPAANFVDELAANIEMKLCRTADCVFSLVFKQRDIAGLIPAQIAYIGFGEVGGRFVGIFKTGETDRWFLGTTKTTGTNNNRLDILAPGISFSVEPYDVLARGWFQGGIVGRKPVWSAPYKNMSAGTTLQRNNNKWSLTRVARVDDPDGKPLGVLAVDVDLNPIAAFLNRMTGRTVAKLSIHAISGEEISVQNGELVITPNGQPTSPPPAGNLIHREVPVTSGNLNGWRLTLTLAPGLSHPVLWGWTAPLLLLAALLASLCLAAFAASSVVDPIKRLSRGVADVSNLRFDAAINVKTRVKEIGLLAATMEKMRAALHRNQQRLEFLAYHDPVSGLLNRAGLSNEYSSMENDSGQVELLLIKIRNHSHITSVLGSAALGRMVVRNIAYIRDDVPGSVAGCISESQIACLCRTEYGLSDQQVERLLQRLRTAHEENGIHCSADIAASVSLRQNREDSFEVLMRRASGALHHAEKIQSTRAIWYNPALLNDLRETLEFQGDIARSITNGDFALEFQPIFALQTMKIEGVQALALWQHPQLGAIEQHKFFAVLETNGYIRDVGLFVISRSFEFLHRFKQRNPEKKLSVCIVLSLVQLLDPLFVERVTELRSEWSVKGDEFVFVILKNAGALDDPQILRSLDKLRSLGFRLAVDYAIDTAGLSKLYSVMSETMVIRPALQRGIEQAGPERTILRSVCRLASELEMHSLAVGIERETVIAPLIECGCNYGMGPWFGDAMSEQEFFVTYTANASLEALIDESQTA
jgi:EAL domain-containing protein (putative c-di-GMP-specific phosphodiesterase class I)/GGDEF domain-containing protein